VGGDVRVHITSSMSLPTTNKAASSAEMPFRFEMNLGAVGCLPRTVGLLARVSDRRLPE